MSYSLFFIVWAYLFLILSQLTHCSVLPVPFKEGRDGSKKKRKMAGAIKMVSDRQMSLEVTEFDNVRSMGEHRRLHLHC